MTRRMVKVAVGAVVALALGCGLFVGSAGAAIPPSVFPPPPAPPRNDNFASAVVLSPDPSAFNISPVAGDIRYATAERGEPNHAGFTDFNAHQSVWYRWTAPFTGVIEFNTCNSHFDTELGIYQPAGPNTPPAAIWNGVTPVAATNPSTGIGQNDDAEPFNYCGPVWPLYFNSRVVFRAVAGTTYRIAVDGYFPSGYVSNSAFLLNYRYCPSPTGRLQGCLGPIQAPV